MSLRNLELRSKPNPRCGIGGRGGHPLRKGSRREEIITCWGAVRCRTEGERSGRVNDTHSDWSKDGGCHVGELLCSKHVQRDEDTLAFRNGREDSGAKKVNIQDVLQVLQDFRQYKMPTRFEFSFTPTPASKNLLIASRAVKIKFWFDLKVLRPFHELKIRKMLTIFDNPIALTTNPSEISSSFWVYVSK